MRQSNIERLDDLISISDAKLDNINTLFAETTLDLNRLISAVNSACATLNSLKPERGYQVMNYVNDVIDNVNYLQKVLARNEISDALDNLDYSIDELKSYYYENYLATIESRKRQ